MGVQIQCWAPAGVLFTGASMDHCFIDSVLIFNWKTKLRTGNWDRPLAGASQGFPGSTVLKNLPANAGRHKRQGFYPWFGKIPYSRKWQPALGFLPGKSMDSRGYWATVHGVAKSQAWLTDWACVCVSAHTHTHMHTHTCTHTLVRLESRQQLEKEVAGIAGADGKEPEACPSSAPNSLCDHLSL